MSYAAMNWRRRHKILLLSGASSALAALEIAAVAPNLAGGDASLLAFYTVNGGLTLSGSAVTFWDDVRGVGYNSGSGAAPTLVGHGTAGGPTFSGGVITGNGTDHYMSHALSAFFNTSNAMTLWIVASTPAVIPALNVLAVIGSGTSFPHGIRTNTTPIYQLNAAGALNNGALTTAPNGSMRLIYVAKDNSATANYAYTVVNHAAQTGTAANLTSNNCQMQVFGYSAPSQFSTSSIRAIAVTNNKAVAGDITAMNNWAQTYHTSVPAA